ncbi:ATP-dependent Clp protease ATP-binding subunit [Patescibacteria group bacterium]|nr:MAG: ATP-dependent Clp protease ATP-binding subunit [Patescibacteria group bacterium]
MNIMDRFSTHLREALVRGIRLATELGNEQVEPAHLLFALFTQKGSVAAEMLVKFKIDSKTIERAIMDLPSRKSERQEGFNAQIIITPLSAGAKAAMEKAILSAQENSHNYIGTEHLLYALIKIKDNILENIFSASNTDERELLAQVESLLANSTKFPAISEMADIFEKIQENLEENFLPPSAPRPNDKNKNKKKNGALEYFAANLTSPDIQKYIDPVIGRQAEIERLEHILCRRTKNNPILLGDPGVGKTAIVEGMAKKILANDVPDILLNKKIYSLDMGLLIAGTIYRGEFEARIKQIIDEVAANPDIILFIDEIHNIVGTGSNQGTMDAANILKPALARGQIRCIGATTPGEYKKYIESDPALERRFQPIYIKQPSVEETIKILSGVRKNYEQYHNLKITNSAIEAAVKLSDRFIANKLLPDKAIDLLDETGAAKRLKTRLPLAEKIHRFGIITADDVARQLAKIIQTPVDSLLLNEKERLVSLEDELKKYIVGQDETIGGVSKFIRQAQLQLSNPNRPMASFLFVGESGVGKTELAKVMAQALYPGREALIKLDMSEFSESHSVSKLLGSPAGYVGYRESNQLIDALKINPYSVILFDEIDKAHKDVSKLLLQMLENGEATDSSGKKVSLKHSVIVLTTSWGAQDIKKSAFGFSGSKTDNNCHSRESGNPVAKETESRLKEKLKEFFSAELINRLDKIFLFNNLSAEDLGKIGQMEIERLNERLKRYKTAVAAEPEFLDWLTRVSAKNSNARDVRQEVRGAIENLMAEIILAENIKDGYSLFVEEDRIRIR